MNIKGQVFFALFMIGIVVIILALALAPVLKERVDSVRNATYDGDLSGLNCTSPNNDFDRGTCILVDMSLPYFIGGLIFIGGAFLTAKIVFS